MASVDGSRSLLGASDEADIHICGACQRKAEYYCEDCSDCLCTPCKDYHKKLPVTKNHIIVSAGEALVNTTIRGRPSTVIYCRCNKQQEVQYYCDDHKEILCDLCKETKHYKCLGTSTIQIKSSAYSSSKLDSVASKLNGIKDDYDQLNKVRNDESKRLERLKEECREAIEAFRKEIDSFLDKLEKNMLKQVESFEIEGQKRISQHVSTLTATMKLLESDLKLVEDAKSDGRKETMFAAGEQVSKDVQGYLDRLGDIENEAIETDMTFEKNAKLVKLLAEIDSLGSLKRSSARKIQTSRKTLLDSKIQSQKQVNIKLTDDGSTPWITGVAVMPTGEAVLCDFHNYKLKLLDSSDAITTSLTLNNQPYDVSVVDYKTVIITLPGSKQLQYIKVFPQLTLVRVLKLDKMCWGVHVTCGKIFTSCHNNPGKGEVRILDLDGNLLQQLGVNQDGSFLFRRPSRITVSPSGKMLFVSDYDNNTVTCMTMDNHVIYQYRDAEMKGPRGLYCDSGDNILVCGQDSNNVQLITADGKKHRTLASSKDGLDAPTSLCYRQSDDTLIVGMVDNKITLFKLGQ